MVTSVVFLVPRPITAWDRHRWGFDLLAEKGMHPRAIDVSAADGEFERVVSASAACTVFIDYLRGISGPDLQTAPIFRALRDAGAIYYVVAAGSLPVATTDHARLWRGLTRPARVLRHVQGIMERAFAERFGGYSPPWKVFGPQAPVVTAFAARHGIPPSRLIPTHSLDYDALLRAEKSAQDHSPCCVFVDDGLAGHPDFRAPGRRAAEPGEYFASLCRVFDRIEAATGYPVVIASHPRGDELHSAVVGGREVIRGRTAELVSGSTLVLGHASTALGLAALARKPILLLGGRHVATAGITGAVKAMAAALGVRVIDPDDAAEVAAIGRQLPEVSETHYARYVAHHVQSPDLPDVSIWEVVARHAGRDLEARR